MADISKITLPDSSEYNIKDAGALRIDGTAAAAKKLVSVHDVPAGMEGVYKFLEIPMQSIAQQTMVLSIDSNFSSSCGLLRIHTKRISNEVFQEIGWIASGKSHPTVRWKYSDNKWNLYLLKSSLETISFHIISATSDSSYTWKLDSVTVEDFLAATAADVYVNLQAASATSDANGDQINTTYLKKTETAALANKLAIAHKSSTPAGWHKILTIPLSDGQRIKFVLIVEEGKSGHVGILRCYFYREENTYGESCSWIAAAGADWREAASTHDTENASVTLYIEKTSTSGVLGVAIIDSMDNNGNIFDLNQYFADTENNADLVAELPSEAKIAHGPIAELDGNGDQIDTTYLKKTETAVRAQKLTNMHYITTSTAGWYKFLSISMGSYTRQTMIIAIENRYGVHCGLLSIHTRRNSSGNEFTGIGWIAAGNATVDVRWEYADGTWTLYAYKSETPSGLYFQVISKTDDSYGTWLSELVAEPTTATAASNYVALRAGSAYQLYPYHSLGGGTGWYKFYDCNIQTIASMVIQADSNRGVGNGIFKIFFNTNSGSVDADVRWVSASGWEASDLRYTVSEGRFQAYIKKSSGTAGRYKFRVLSTAGNNDLSFDPSPYWTSEAVSEPTTAIIASDRIYNTTSKAIGSYTLFPTKVYPGTLAAGWYKFAEVNITTTTGRAKITFKYGLSNSSYDFIGDIFVYKTNSTTMNCTMQFPYISSGKTTYFRYNVDNSTTVSFYVYKHDASGNPVFTFITSEDINGNYLDPSTYMLESLVAETPPATALKPIYSGINRWVNNVPVSPGTNQQILSYSHNMITSASVLAKVEFANPEYIKSDCSWETTDGANPSSSGTITLTGTCTTATTANLLILNVVEG